MAWIAGARPCCATRFLQSPNASLAQHLYARRRPARAAAAAHRHHRRRHGHHDPALQAGRGRLPRCRAAGPPEGPEGQQRPAGADAARRGARDPRPVPGGGRRHHRDQHLRRHLDRAGRLRPGAPGARDEPGRRAHRPRGRRRRRHARASRASWPAPWAPRRAPPASAPTSTTPARATPASTNCAPPTASRRRRCWKAAATCSWWKPSSTR